MKDFVAALQVTPSMERASEQKGKNKANNATVDRFNNMMPGLVATPGIGQAGAQRVANGAL